MIYFWTATLMPSSAEESCDQMGKGRITIGLYNAYDQNKFREPHRRVIARAGDLALAFNMNLVIFGFPIPEDTSTPLEVAQWIAGTTSIGDDGGNFLKLAEQGRFMRFPYPSKGFPPQLGEPILTTSKPDSKSNCLWRGLSIWWKGDRAYCWFLVSDRMVSPRSQHPFRSTISTSRMEGIPWRPAPHWVRCAEPLTPS